MIIIIIQSKTWTHICTVSKGSNMMVVIEPDLTAVIYSGVVRIGSLYAHYSFNRSVSMPTVSMLQVRSTQFSVIRTVLSR